MIYVTGDIHGSIDIRKLNNNYFPQQKELTKNDYVIILGDFGLIWNNSNEEKYWLNWLKEKNFTTLFVDGNHENHNLLDNYEVKEWNGGKVHFINDSIIHLMRGQIYNIDNIKIFTFGGAESIDKNRRKKDISWWEREMPSTLEYEEGLNNLDKYNWEVDYILTHTCSEKTFEELSKYMINLYKIPTAIEKYFNILEGKVKYKHWYFGHFHDNGTLDNKHTLLYHNIEPIDSFDKERI